MAKKEGSTFGSNIIYYCKDCEKIVNAKRAGRRYVFKCDICGTKNVAFGTQKSIRAFFHIEDDEEDEVGKKDEKDSKNKSK